MAVIQGINPITNERLIIPVVRGEAGPQGPPGPAGIVDAEDVTTILGFTPLNRAGDTMSGKFAPGVVALTDAATIATNAALGSVFQVTLGGNRTIAVPSNPTNGQAIEYQLRQDASGNRTVSWASGAGGFAFGASSAPTLSTTADKLDRIGFRYHAGLGAWLYTGALLGF